MSAYLIVRAQVAPEDREAFDHWYQTEHLPDAHAAFKSLSAQRGWVEDNPSLHVAIYAFSDLAEAQRIAYGSPQITELIAEFDRVWQDRVRRTREVVGVVQSLQR